jgi:hypothetical protein
MVGSVSCRVAHIPYRPSTGQVSPYAVPVTHRPITPADRTPIALKKSLAFADEAYLTSLEYAAVYLQSSPIPNRKAPSMSDRRTFTFEHRGCTLTVAAGQKNGAWHTRFHMKCPIEGRQYALSGREGPYASVEEAFEKARQWAFREMDS